jgi:hypothetical protein
MYQAKSTILPEKKGQPLAAGDDRYNDKITDL